jgi:hypothetical protein
MERIKAERAPKLEAAKLEATKEAKPEGAPQEVAIADPKEEDPEDTGAHVITLGARIVILLGAVARGAFDWALAIARGTRKEESMKTARKPTIVALLMIGLVVIPLLCAVIAFGWFVWPSRYRYDHMSIRGTMLPVRIDRLSGKTEVLRLDGWNDISPRGGEESAELPASELARLQISGTYGYECVNLALYNGSGWRVRELTAGIGVRDRTGKELFFRDYLFRSSSDCSPLTSGAFSANTGHHLAVDAGQTWYFTVKRAGGRPAQ